MFLGMDGLPWQLVDEILFRLDPISLAMMRCTDRSLRSRICDDPHFKSQYLCRVGSSVLHTSTRGCSLLCFHLYGDSRLPIIEETLEQCHVLDSCSGLLLLFVNGLCVANPLTKKFRFLNHFTSKFFPGVDSFQEGRKQIIGFAVDQIDRTTQSFKIVIINEVKNGNETTYGFEINAGDSWKLSETTITCTPRYLSYLVKKPVYLKGSLHWLRNDGSIVAFNPKTEQARLIPIGFPKKPPRSKTLFAADVNNLTLILATEEVIYLYALENILSGDPMWVLGRRLSNGVVGKKRLRSWYLEAYDGKCLVLRGDQYFGGHRDRVIHGYDLRANKWEVVGSIPQWCDEPRDFFQFSPSPSSVIGLDQEEILACDDDKRISSINSIMGLFDQWNLMR